MNIKFSKAFLMSGKDFELTPYITFHHPTVSEIISINKSPDPDSVYWKYVQILLSDPYSNMVMLDDMGKNYLDVSPYEVFVIQWDAYKAEYVKNKDMYDSYGLNPLEDITNALQFFTSGSSYFEKGIYSDGTICFYDVNNPEFQINEEIFGCLHEWVKSINKIDYSNRIKPADESARRVLIEDMRDEIKKARKRKKKSNDGSGYFGMAMSAVSFCGNGAITPYNIGECKLYWLNEAISISTKKDHSGHILDGIYHGTINPKDIDKKEIDWLK